MPQPPENLCRLAHFPSHPVECVSPLTSECQFSLLTYEGGGGCACRVNTRAAPGALEGAQETGARRATQGGGAFTQVCGELALGQNQQLPLDPPNGLLSSRGCENKRVCPSASSKRRTHASWVPEAACVVRLWVRKAVCLCL